MDLVLFLQWVTYVSKARPQKYPSSRSNSPEGLKRFIPTTPHSKKEKSPRTYLPLLHIVLLSLILLRQLLEDLVHVVRVGFELRQDVADGALDQHAVDHAEALAVAGQRCEGFEDQSGKGFVSCQFEVALLFWIANAGMLETV